MRAGFGDVVDVEARVDFKNRCVNFVEYVADTGSLSAFSIPSSIRTLPTNDLDHRMDLVALGTSPAVVGM